MRILVLYFSRTGTTLAVGTEIASRLDADVQALDDRIKWSGFLGAINAGRMTLFGGLSRLKPLTVDLTSYGLIILGTPVWASRPSVPLRTFLQERKAELPHLAFFCTQDGNGGERVMAAMTTLATKSPVATLIVTKSDVRSGASDRQVSEFCQSIAGFADKNGRLRAVS